MIGRGRGMMLTTLFPPSVDPISMPFPSEIPPSTNPYAAPSTVATEPIDDTAFDSLPFDPLKSVWFHPRRTVRRLVAENPTLYVIPLACLSGIGETLDRASMRNAGETISVATIVGIAVLLGPLGGLFSLWIGSHLIRIAGNWIGGHADRVAIKTAMAWSSVPTVVALVLWIPQIVLFGSDMFTAETPRLDAQPLLWIPLLGISLIEIILVIWAVVLFCQMIAEVQGYRSAWKGLGNVLLAGALIIVPLVALVIGFGVLA